MRRLDCIAHHGILGQKWGVRRFQNKDGSLTQAGKNRIGYSKEDRAAYIAKKTAKIDKDIHSFDSLRGKGFKDKKGRELLSKEDVEKSVKGLEATKAKIAAKADWNYTKKYGKEDLKYGKKVTKDALTGKFANYDKLYKDKRYSGAADKEISKMIKNMNMDVARRYGQSPSGRYTVKLVENVDKSGLLVTAVDSWKDK